jgi:hypothetical protein
MRPWVSAGLSLAPLLALGSPLEKLDNEFVDGEVPQLEYVRATAEAVLAPVPHANCFSGGDDDDDEASFSAQKSIPRTITPECARASIPALDRNGDYTANVSVAELTHNRDNRDNSRGLFLPRAAKGAEITLFPTVPCGASARFFAVEGSGRENATESPKTTASPIRGRCSIEAAVPITRSDRFASGAERFSIFAAPGDAIQDWRDTPAPTQEPQFRVYDEEWAVGCLGLSDVLWECYSMVPSRRDRAGEGVALEPGWNVDRHAEVLVEKRLLRGELDWDSQVPLCDVPVFDAAAEAQAHPDTLLHELFSERYRREGAHTPVLIVNDPANAEFETMDRGLRPENLADEDNPGALLFRDIEFAKLKRQRFYNRFRLINYNKMAFFEDWTSGPKPAAQLALFAFPGYPDPTSLRDPRVQPHINAATGARASELFFDRDSYRFGGSGTSTTFHAHRGNWLRVHSGAKIWFFYPPRSKTVPRAMVPFGLHPNYTDEAVAATWLLRTDDILGGPAHPLLNFSYAQSVREGVPPKVCIQRPNTFMFVGDDWLHGVVNIGLTVSTGFSQVGRIY